MQAERFSWISRSVDIGIAIPKAFITIALIPPILKYIFGWEKKKHADNQSKLVDGGIK